MCALGKLICGFQPTKHTGFYCVRVLSHRLVRNFGTCGFYFGNSSVEIGHSAAITKVFVSIALLVQLLIVSNGTPDTVDKFFIACSHLPSSISTLLFNQFSVLRCALYEMLHAACYMLHAAAIWIWIWI